MTATTRTSIIELPLRGEWKLPRSPLHDRFAFDFQAVVAGRTQAKRFWNAILGRLSVEDFYSWEHPVYAPFDGMVVAAHDGWPDRMRVNLVADVLRLLWPGPALDADDLRPATGNYILVEAGGIVALLAHLRQGSLRVAAGDTVHAGQNMAQVGNSGRSLMPHLHLQMMDGRDPLTAKIVPFKVRAYERWNGRSWEPVSDGTLEKGSGSAMTGKPKWLYSLLLLTSTLLMVVLRAKGTAAQPQFDFAAIDQFIAGQRAVQRVPGLALAITQGDQVLYVKGYGTAGQGQPMTPQSQFFLASVSKSFTALAVIQLVEAGQIDLDLPLQTYLPEFTLADPAAAGQITVRHLLNQTSGLADAGLRTAQPPQQTTIAAYVADLRMARPVAPPGREFHYTDANYVLLARVVEVVNGEPFSAYLQTHIFAPLQMAQTFHAVTSAEAKQRAEQLAQGHLVAYGMPVAVDEMSGFVGAAGAFYRHRVGCGDGAHHTEWCGTGAPQPAAPAPMGRAEPKHSGVATRLRCRMGVCPGGGIAGAARVDHGDRGTSFWVHPAFAVDAGDIPLAGSV